MSAVVWAVVDRVRWDGPESIVVCGVGVGRWVCVVGECVMGGDGVVSVCRVMLGVVLGACGGFGAIIYSVEACGGRGFMIGG